MRTPRGFTAIELLVTIGIMAVVSTLTVLIVNPVELFKESRDAQRISDLAQIVNALELANVARLPLGSANTAYVSVPQSGGVCPSLTPTLAAGYTYLCASDTTYENVDGTGWIPVNFSQSIAESSPLIKTAQAASSPFLKLPTDPKNDIADSLFYGYILNGRKYQVFARMESEKYLAKAAEDGGADVSRYEIGSILSLWGLASDGGSLNEGLAGRWKFDEGAGTTAADSTGNGSTATFASWNGVQYPQWTSGKFGGGITLPAVAPYTAYLELGNPSVLDMSTGDALTVSAWIKPNITPGVTGHYRVVAKAINSGLRQYSIHVGGQTNPATKVYFRVTTGGGLIEAISPAMNSLDFYNVWFHIVGVYDGASAKVYINGVDQGVGDSGSGSPIYQAGPVRFGTTNGTDNYYGDIDEVRIYDRALSGVEVQALYSLSY